MDTTESRGVQILMLCVCVKQDVAGRRQRDQVADVTMWCRCSDVKIGWELMLFADRWCTDCRCWAASVWKFNYSLCCDNFADVLMSCHDLLSSCQLKPLLLMRCRLCDCRNLHLHINTHILQGVQHRVNVLKMSIFQLLLTWPSLCTDTHLPTLGSGSFLLMTGSQHGLAVEILTIQNNAMGT